jgi:hypothetical protein
LLLGLALVALATAAVSMEIAAKNGGTPAVTAMVTILTGVTAMKKKLRANCRVLAGQMAITGWDSRPSAAATTVAGPHILRR